MQMSVALISTTHNLQDGLVTITKDLIVTITKDFTWITHISNVCTQSPTEPMNFRRALFSCPKDVKEADYKSLV